MNTDTRAITRRRLPIGMQTFRKVREEHCYYVDKTAYIRRLLDEGEHYFLSRPRRFGKSLFLDTCKELFEGNEGLFEGLAIHEQWDWSVRHPVLRLSFGSGNFKEPGHLPATVMAQLDAVERETGVVSGYASASDRFGHMLDALHRQAGRPVAVLVDEYDKPILDALETPEVARANRDFLRGLYATIKDCDAHVRFTFLTGVSKFSKVSLFSGLNNLTDITLDPRFSAICGYSDADLDSVFAPELPGLDRGQIRDWYNGYSWRGEEKVYNPFDILLLFRNREFDAYWFETGTRGAGRPGSRAGAIENEELRRQVPRPGRARPPGRGGIQQRVAQRGGVRPRDRLTRRGARSPVRFPEPPAWLPRRYTAATRVSPAIGRFGPSLNASLRTS